MSAEHWRLRQIEHDMNEQSRIEVVNKLALTVFESEKIALEWMATPNEALGGNTPLMQCKSEVGARQVRRVLNALEYGGVV